jgi:folate receptor
MLQESCFYECDPYLDLWRVKDFSTKRRTERYYKIPLCQNYCKLWFDDCKNDYTCSDNWYKGFNWNNGNFAFSINLRFVYNFSCKLHLKKGVNYCVNNSQCITIKNRFKNAKNFCEKVWDESFKVVDETKQKCLTFEFNEKKENPNKAAAEFYETHMNHQ